MNTDRTDKWIDELMYVQNRWMDEWMDEGMDE